MTTKRQDVLDSIVHTYLGQPAGNGYTDLIVRRNVAHRFLNDLSEAGFCINGISLWEHCPTEESRPVYGYGGPRSIFFDGWFAELPINDLDLAEIEILDPKAKNFKYEAMINNYEFRIAGGNSISFSTNYSLNPSFDIEVPTDWICKLQESSFAKTFKMNFERARMIINRWDPLDLIRLGAPKSEYDIEIYDFLPRILIGNKDVLVASSQIRNSFSRHYEAIYKSEQKTEERITLEILETVLEEANIPFNRIRLLSRVLPHLRQNPRQVWLRQTQPNRLTGRSTDSLRSHGATAIRARHPWRGPMRLPGSQLDRLIGAWKYFSIPKRRD